MYDFSTPPISLFPYTPRSTCICSRLVALICAATISISERAEKKWEIERRKNTHTIKKICPIIISFHFFSVLCFDLKRKIYAIRSEKLWLKKKKIPNTINTIQVQTKRWISIFTWWFFLCMCVGAVTNVWLVVLYGVVWYCRLYIHVPFGLWAMQDSPFSLFCYAVTLNFNIVP